MSWCWIVSCPNMTVCTPVSAQRVCAKKQTSKRHAGNLRGVRTKIQFQHDSWFLLECCKLCLHTRIGQFFSSFLQLLATCNFPSPEWLPRLPYQQICPPAMQVTYPEDDTLSCTLPFDLSVWDKITRQRYVTHNSTFSIPYWISDKKAESTKSSNVDRRLTTMRCESVVFSGVICIALNSDAASCVITSRQ